VTRVAPVVPPLVALRAFDALGRTGSVRRAAEMLHVSHTVVSRHIRNLQDQLGVTLVSAEGRGLRLTAQGRRYHQQIASAFETIASATSILRGEADRNLSVWCAPGIANRRLLSALPLFAAPGARATLNLQPTLQRPNLLAGEADAEIIYSEVAPDHEGLAIERLIHPRTFPVASPALLAGRSLNHPRDLLRLPLLHEESAAQWRSWFSRCGVDAVGQLSGPRLWHAHLALDAARLGQGVALANEVLVAEDLKEGRLIEPVSSDIKLGAYYLAVSKARCDEPRIKDLRAWLRAVLRELVR
jgi:LysR family glycine cleavage system transcriptional activator